jgi:hypothetical protein
MISDDAELQNIVEEYVRDLPGRFVNLAKCLESFAVTSAPGYLIEAISQAHRLRGTGTVFGQPWVSDIAAHVEDNLKAVQNQIRKETS